MRASIFFLIFCFAFWEAQAAVNCTCGVTSTGTRIFGGTVATKNKYTWMAFVSMRVNSTSGFMCGGSLITSRHVVTAAHCTQGFAPSAITVSLGEHDRSTATETNYTQIMAIIAKYEHAQYSSTTFANDIALLVTRNVVQMTAGVRPACLPKAPFNIDGQSVRILGWGTTELQSTSTVLKEANVNVVALATCRLTFPQVTTNQQCVASPVAGFCRGDSGGPTSWWNSAESRYILTGITSFGRAGPCAAGVPSVNTYVAAYIGWIQAQIQASRPLVGTAVNTCAVI